MREPDGDSRAHDDAVYSGTGAVYWLDVYSSERDSFSVADLNEWMKTNGVPQTAEFTYPHCGSHGLGLTWKVEKDDR